MVYQYAIKITEYVDEEDYTLFYDLVSAERKTKISNYIFIMDKLRCLLAEVLLRYILWKHFSIKDDISFTYNEYGKPQLEFFNQIYFNISHSGDWVLCGVADNPIGVDVEKVIDIDINIARRFFTLNEYNYILQQPIEKQKYIFFMFWTLKESFIKAIGKGLNIPLNSFSFQLINDQIKFINGNRIEDLYSFSTKELDADHHISLCIKSNKEHDLYKNVEILTINNLIEWYHFYNNHDQI